MAFVDSGYLTDLVYKFCSGFGNGVYPVKGSDAKYNGRNQFKSSKVEGEHDVILINISVDYYKDKFFGWLKLNKTEEKPVPWGYPFYPNDYPDSFFKGYTNEQRLEKIDAKGNLLGYAWVRRSSTAFNEPWDLRVYNMCAFDFLIHIVKEYEELSLDVDEFFEFIANSES